MKHLLLAILVLLFALLTAACNAFSSEPPPPQSSAPAQPSASTGTVAEPSTACNSRLFGKLTNTATNKTTGNASIQVSSAGKTIKTITDRNGMYGFLGLCAGEYAITYTPPEGTPITRPDKVKLDGTQPFKLDLTYK